MRVVTGINVKEYRKKKKLSQSEFGEKLGMKKAIVCTWERGGFIPYSRQGHILSVYSDFFEVIDK